jgi:sulfide:quinone oxidoreductase
LHLQKQDGRFCIGIFVDWGVIGSLTELLVRSSSMSNSTIVILGAGIGGIVTARELRRHLGPKHRIVVVDRSAVHSFPPSYLWVMIGWRKAPAIQRPLSFLEKYGIEFHQGSIERIDTNRGLVTTDRETLEYDYLVVALGAENSPQLVPGHESSHSFYTLEGAEKLAAIVPTINDGDSIAIVVASVPHTYPPAPYEAAFLLESYLTRKSIRNSSITIHTPEAEPFMVAGPLAGQSLRSLMKQRGIGLETARSVSRILPEQHCLEFTDGSTAAADLTILVPPHRPPDVIRASTLASDEGWIPVDQRTLCTNHERVFAVGDTATIPLANGHSLPKTATIALHEAEVVAQNIAAEITGGGLRKEFAGNGYCFVETGNGRAGYIAGSFLTHPSPTVTVHEPNVTFHWGKVVFEKYWLWRWL